MSEVMIPRTVQPGAQSFETTTNICLALWVTPASRWERMLPLFEAVGFSMPPQATAQIWMSEVCRAAPIGRLGVAALKPMHNPALRAATDDLFAKCAPPVLVSSAEDSEKILADLRDREIPDSRLVLLHERPERILVEAMRAGADPGATLEQWIRACRRVLDFYRRNRARTSLLDVDVVLASPAGFIEFCARSFGSSVPARIPKPFIQSPQPGLTHLIAAQMVTQSREAKRLLTELEASSLPIGDPQEPVHIDCVAVFHEQQKQRTNMDAIVRERDQALVDRDLLQAELRKREASLGELDARQTKDLRERELLLLQLNQLQEELEGLSKDMRRLSDSAAAQQAERERLEGRMAELSAAREGQNRRIADLVSDRERQVREIQELQAWIAQLETERTDIAALAERRNIEAIQLRSRLEAADARIGEAKQDNELLLLQLHQAQEELESSYRQFQSASARQKKTEEELRQTSEALACSTKALASATEELRLTRERLGKSKELLALARKKISYRERRIQYLENSRSWKMTAPLRAILGIFSRRGSGDREDVVS